MLAALASTVRAAELDMVAAFAAAAVATAAADALAATRRR
jgi:hypothetical protein